MDGLIVEHTELVAKKLNEEFQDDPGIDEAYISDGGLGELLADDVSLEVSRAPGASAPLKWEMVETADFEAASWP